MSREPAANLQAPHPKLLPARGEKGLGGARDAEVAKLDEADRQDVAHRAAEACRAEPRPRARFLSRAISATIAGLRLVGVPLRGNGEMRQ